MLKKFMENIIYYCNGKGNPWRLIIVWFFLLNVCSLLIGFFFLWLSTLLIETVWIIPKLIGILLSYFTGILGMIITFVYPLIFIYALWRSAPNVKWEPEKYIARLMIIPFIVIHYFLGYAYFFVSLIMFYASYKTVKEFLM